MKMNKLIKTLFLGIFLLGISVSAQAENKLSLSFAENCKTREGCEYFKEEGNTLVRENVLSKGERVVVDVVISNTNNQEINSVASWIKYDPAKLNALEINDESSTFDLAAPDGNKINKKEGLVQIGRAKIGGTAKDQEIPVVSVIFEVITDQKTETNLEFHNYQQSELGNTGVFAISGSLTENLLTEAPKTLKLSLNGENTNNNQGNNQNNNTGNNNDNNGDVVVNDNTNLEDPFSTILERPTNLRLKSGNKKADLVWDFNEKASGYFVYYSTQSGVYLFRKDVGKTNNTSINNLENNKKYYFAITAYDDRRNETDYSDEVFAIIGQTGSESHPIYTEYTTTGDELVNPNTGKTSDTGAKEAILIALLLTSGALLIRQSFKLTK